MKWTKLKGTVTIPRKPITKNAILPWATQVTQAIRQLTERLAPMPSGGSTSNTLPPFWVSVWEDPDTPDSFFYNVEPGYATWQNINGIIGYHTPTLGGTSLEEDDPQPHGTLPAVASSVYLKVITTNKGVITGTPTIEEETSSPSDAHHIPPSEGESGQGGTYFWLIAEFADDGNGRPTAVRRVTGNKHTPNQLIELENIGDGLNIVKEYDSAADTHEVRTIRGRTDSTPSIVVKYTGVEATSDEIIVQGNDIDGSVTFTRCGANKNVTLDYIDGPVNSPAAIIEIDALPDDGVLGDMLYYDGDDWCRVAKPTTPSSSTVINLLTHNGTIPAWSAKDIETISVCVSGTPTDWDIIKL